MRRRNFLLAILAGASLATPAAAPSELERKITDFVEKNNLPGIVTLVQQGDEVVHYSAVGPVNVDEGPDMEEDAIFRIFSMSKPIVAVGLLQLVDQGRIALDDDIREHLPAFDPFEFDGQEFTVTVHHLLSHTGGFGYGGGFRSWAEIRYLIANPLSRSNTLNDMIDDVSGIDLMYAPGQQWQYSIASDIQGALIEAVSGLPLDEYLRKFIFEPLDMRDTGFWVTPERADRLVDMYEYDADGLSELAAFNPDDIEFQEFAHKSDYLEEPVLLSGGGGLVSTARDFSHFAQMLLAKGEFGGERLLSAELVERMVSSHTIGLDTSFLPHVYPNTGFGYGIGVKEKHGDTRPRGSFYWAGMGGTVFWGDPENDLIVVAMMQVEDGWVALERWLIPEVYSLLE